MGKIKKSSQINLIWGLIVIIGGSIVLGWAVSVLGTLPFFIKSVYLKNPLYAGLTVLLCYIPVVIGMIWYSKKIKMPRWTVSTTNIVAGGLIILMVCEFALMAFNGWINGTSTTPNNNTVMSFNQNKWVFLLAIVVLSPIMEELVFRGVCQRQLSILLCRSGFVRGDMLGLVVSSLVFGLMHQGGTLIGQLTYVIMGLIMGLVYLRTKDLRASVAVHILNNLIAIL